MSKIGIVMGVSSTYSFLEEVDLPSMSSDPDCSGTVVNFLGDPLPLIVTFDNDSTELSMADRSSPGGGDPMV
jgi:hypothetical protein